MCIFPVVSPSASDARLLRQACRCSGEVWLAETGESVALGRINKRKRWDSQRALPRPMTLGAMCTGVKRYDSNGQDQ